MTAPQATAAPPLTQPVTSLWGVGGERAAQLARLGIHTVEDLLLHRPRRYEDRRQFRPFNRLSTAEASLTRGTVAAMGVKTYRKGAKSVFELILDDSTARLHCRWWNLPFMENYFEVGDDVLVYGKLTGLKPRTMDHPETEVVEEGEENSIHMGRIVPVYPLTEGVQQRWLRGLIWRTLDKVGHPSRLSADSQTGADGGGAVQPVEPADIPEQSKTGPRCDSTPEATVSMMTGGTPVLPFRSLDRGAPIACYGRHLPHWRQEGATYFVTFRLADSIPQAKLRQWEAEMTLWLEQHPEPRSDADYNEYHGRFTERFQRWLDAGMGLCLLKNSDVRRLVEDALTRFDGQRYWLGHYVIMPNHVHAVVRPIQSHLLKEILHSWKSFTAHRINKLLGCTGRFWQDESFDVLVRNEHHLEEVSSYIRDNPGKAKLANGTFTLGSGSSVKVGQASSLSSNSLTPGGDEQAVQPESPATIAEQSKAGSGRESFSGATGSMMTGKMPVLRSGPQSKVGQASRLSSDSLTRGGDEQAVQPERPAATAEKSETGSRRVSTSAATGSMMTGGTPVLQAIRMLHCPETIEDTERARERLALNEFIALQRQFRERRQRFESKARGLPCRGDNHLIKPFLVQLGFTLTDAQTRVLREIRKDMGAAHPMRRLLQGDVGSGKTVVAACTALMALESGFSVALMAPTEILAEQHYNNFQKWLESLNVPVVLRTGGRKTFNILHSTSNPGSLLIGTHALLTEGVEIPKLGLVIIDEQHKFGVAHREDLVRKGSYPHLLVMTATPIPRSLGLTMYGDLDLSVIDQLPADRGRIRTHVRSRDKLAKVWEFVKDQLAAGRQAYVVYPRVEETDGGLTRAVKEEFGRIQAALDPHTVAMLHGRLRAAEKSTVMEDFRTGRVKALVATSPVEVGLDVPNATVMVIEDAERFGLAQLHQLRGRIGRGAHESHCILVAGKLDEPARERLKILESTTDGFAIAEADLRLRGPGELLGQQQSGALRLRFGSLVDDVALIQQAREMVMGRSLAGSS